MSIDFNSGDDAGINCGDVSSNQDIDPLTVTAWIYPTGWGELNFGRVACKELLTPSGWNLFVDNSGDPNGVESISAIRWRATTDTIIRAADYSISLNEWQHVAVTFSATPALFVNGPEVGSYKAYQAGAGAVSTDVTADLLIGNRPGLDRDFDGRIEDVRFYNAILTDDEIQAIYMGRGHDQIVRSLVGRYTLTEKAPGVAISTSDVIDISNNKNDGTSEYESTEYEEGVIALRRRLG